MNKLNIKQFAILITLTTGCTQAQPKPPRLATQSTAPLQAQLAPYDGCMIIEQTNTKTSARWQHGTKACITPRSPCSTFKLPHTLIALQTDTLKANETVPWDGKKRFFSAWNRPQTLQSALKYSTVWFFKRTARLIGEQTMQQHLNAMTYGNKDISGGLERFWLRSSLLISPTQQLDFLHAATQHAVPTIDQKHTKTMWDALEPIELPSGATVKGKTGSCRQQTGDHGWFIGKIEHKTKTYVFATLITQPTSTKIFLGSPAKRRALKTIDTWIAKQTAQ